MRKTILSMLLISSTALVAQIGNRENSQPANRAPAPVQQSFQKEHPEANNTRWSQSNHEWRANYKDKYSRNVDVYYDREGVRKDVHRAMDRKDVPSEVNNRVNSRFHTNGNYSVARIERPNAETLFQVKIRSGRRYRTVYMDEQGRNKSYNDRH